MSPPNDHLHLPRPSIDDFIFEGEETPLLLRRSVVAAIVVGFLVLVAAYFVVAELLGVTYDIDAEPFRDWVDQWGIWGPIVYMAVLAVSVLFAPIPNAPIFIAAGLAWGPVVGTIYSMAGMILGSAMAFAIARRFGRRHLPRLIGGKAASRVDHLMISMGGKIIFWARMMPVVNFDILSYIAGLTAIRFWSYILWSSAGMLVPTTIAVVAGDSLAEDIRITLGLGGLWVAGVVASAFYFWRRQQRWQARRREQTAAAATPPPGPAPSE